MRASLLRFIVGAAMALALISCGGGGAVRPDAPVPVAPGEVAPGRAGILFGYYGTTDGELASVADHVNVVWIAPWDPTRVIADLQEARARGVTGAVLDVSGVIFSERRYIGTARALPALRTLFASISAQGLLPMVRVIYTIDEPDLNLAQPGEVVQANADIRTVLAELALQLPLATIYTDHRSWPGIESFDWVGCDQYGKGPCDAPIRAQQRLLLVAGGADPWREDASLYARSAQSDARVAMVVAFAWFPVEGPGIGTNGLLPAYRAIGCELTRRC